MSQPVKESTQKPEEQPSKTVKFDRHRKTSSKRGLAGVLETFIRSFRVVSYLLLIAPIYILCMTLMGISIAVPVYLSHLVYQSVQPTSLFALSLFYGFSVSFGYFVYGMTLMFSTAFMNKVLFLKLKPWKGSWRSNQVIPWYFHNALVYLVRYTFLEFVTPSPLNNLYYRLMGMKIGKGVVINTTRISDPSLITIEDDVTIGGSATIVAHYGQKGILVLSPVRLGKGSNIGLQASVMGGADIGEYALVKPHAVVMPRVKVPDRGVVD